MVTTTRMGIRISLILAELFEERVNNNVTWPFAWYIYWKDIRHKIKNEEKKITSQEWWIHFLKDTVGKYTQALTTLKPGYFFQFHNRTLLILWRDDLINYNKRRLTELSMVNKHEHHTLCWDKRANVTLSKRTIILVKSIVQYQLSVLKRFYTTRGDWQSNSNLLINYLTFVSV